MLLDSTWEATVIIRYLLYKQYILLTYLKSAISSEQSSILTFFHLGRLQKLVLLSYQWHLPYMNSATALLLVLVEEVCRRSPSCYTYAQESKHKSESCALSNRNFNSFQQLEELLCNFNHSSTWTIFLGNNLAVFQCSLLRF